MRRRIGLVLIVNDGPESSAAREFLSRNGLRFNETAETSVPYGPSYQPPTLLVSGRVFSGLERIKDAVYYDFSLSM